jgi:hypothetical protein
MKAERSVPVKITRPGLSGVVHRKRLFGLLDARGGSGDVLKYLIPEK